MSVSFNGQDIKGSPFDLRVHCVSAEQSYLEVNTLFPSKVDLKIIVAVDHDGTPLKQGGDQFTGSVTINDQPQVGIGFLSFFNLNNTDCFVFLLTGCPNHSRPAKRNLHPLLHSDCERQVRGVGQVRGERDQGQSFHFRRL